MVEHRADPRTCGTNANIDVSTTSIELKRPPTCGLCYNLDVRYLIGIDEAGRGPLAGPVAVGAVIVPRNFNWAIVKGVRDSKQLTPHVREEWYERLRALRREAALNFAVSFSSAATIDRRGIVPAIQSALNRSLYKLTENRPLYTEVGSLYQILLDGGLRAPEEFTFQKTIIRGDESEPLIALASIMAKVTRDRLMRRLASKYPVYDFHVHKGYGTPAHRRSIVENGRCKLHRSTFCTKL